MSTVSTGHSHTRAKSERHWKLYDSRSRSNKLYLIRNDLNHDLYFLGNMTTKNPVFMGLYRKCERLKKASNPFIISI